MANIYPKEIKLACKRDIFMSMITATQLTIAKIGNQKSNG